MTRRTSTEVLIVGAGPTGLTLACHCAQLGVQARVIDRKERPATTSRAIGLQYRASELLACLGVVDRFRERGSSPTRVNLYADGQRLVQLKFEGLAEAGGHGAFSPCAIMLPQSDTEGLLGDLLRERGGAVEWGTELVAFEQSADRAVARLRHADGTEEEVTAAFLVSCEGADSLVRKQAGIAFAGKTYPQAFFMADVEVRWPRPHGEHHVWLHKEGSFAALSMPRPGTWRLFVEVTRQGGPPREVTPGVIGELMAQRTGEAGFTLGEPTWASETRVNCRMAERFRAGRVFLAGDAAHVHSPTGGQGIVTGAQDATNLAWKLAAVLRGAPAALLDTYEEERQPKAREALEQTDKMAGLLTASSGWARALRDLVVLPALRCDWVQRRMLGKLAQLHVHYRGARLSRHEDRRWFGRARVRAGDRAPDVAFRRPFTAEPVTLFGLLRAMRPVALIGLAAGERAERLLGHLAEAGVDAYLVGPDHGMPRALAERYLIDEYGELERLYGMTGEYLCVVRPDDHIGLFQRPIHEGRLREYLRQVCPAEAVAW